MTISKTRSELAGLRNAALDDLMATSDEQIRLEAAEAGTDIDALAVSVGSIMEEAAAAAMRERLILAKERMRTKQSSDIRLVRPSIESIKQLIQRLFQTDKNLGMAFREGKVQTDADWESLYDDLVEMGVIKPSDQND